MGSEDLNGRLGCAALIALTRRFPSTASVIHARAGIAITRRFDAERDCEALPA
jgi:hypothetical protein